MPPGAVVDPTLLRPLLKLKARGSHLPCAPAQQAGRLRAGGTRDLSPVSGVDLVRVHLRWPLSGKRRCGQTARLPGSVYITPNSAHPGSEAGLLFKNTIRRVLGNGRFEPIALP